MGPCHALRLNIHSIDPVLMGLAVQLDDHTEILYCTQLGYILISRLDDTIHLQPVLVNNTATDFIISPEAILQASDDLFSYT